MGDDANTFRFLITTDNHLGFMERDARRGDDSFVTFEEALAIGREEYDCDAVLLGGDLFHDNKPSLSTLTRSLSLFKKYVLGSKDIAFDVLSDPATNFPTHPAPIANFQDPNLNVAMPVFMIHGNHDDPIGGVSAIDVLATAGLVNYFGQTEDVDDIIVRPVLLQKGTTRVALYGLGNVRDERLHRCFAHGKVRFVRPKEDVGSWLNILILHQNRGTRTQTSKCGITEDMLDGFGFDLVIWGNEHEQRMTPMAVNDSLEIIQPGSTVMTSLSAAESNPKQCGVLEVLGTKYRLTPKTLQTVRPVVRRTIELASEASVSKTLDSVEDYLRKVMDDMLREAEGKIARIPDNVLRLHPNVKFPLMRLSVDFSDKNGATSFPQPNYNRFGQKFMDVVVNPNELLRPVKPKAVRVMLAGREHDPAARDLDGILAPPEGMPGPRANLVTTDDIRTKIAQVFSENAKDACALLSEPEVSHAVHSFVEKQEKAAIAAKVQELLTRCQKTVWKSVSKAPNDVSRQVIADIATTHKRECNAKYFERHEGGVEGGGADAAAADGTVAGVGGGSTGAVLPPAASVAALAALDDDMPQPMRSATGFRELAVRSAAALSGVGLGDLGGGGDDVVIVDGPAHAAGSSSAGVGDGAAAQPPAVQAPAVAAAQPPTPAAPAKKRGRKAAGTEKAPAAPRSRKQPPAPAAPAPQLATKAVNPTSALMARWGAAGGGGGA